MSTTTLRLCRRRLLLLLLLLTATKYCYSCCDHQHYYILLQSSKYQRLLVLLLLPAIWRCLQARGSMYSNSLFRMQERLSPVICTCVESYCYHLLATYYTLLITTSSYLLLFPNSSGHYLPLSNTSIGVMKLLHRMFNRHSKLQHRKRTLSIRAHTIEGCPLGLLNQTKLEDSKRP